MLVICGRLCYNKEELVPAAASPGREDLLRQ